MRISFGSAPPHTEIACYMCAILSINFSICVIIWNTHFSCTSFRQLDVISNVQSTLNAQRALPKVLIHLSRKSDKIVCEVLSFISVMLFNANKESQVRDCFKHVISQHLYLLLLPLLPIAMHATILPQHSRRKLFLCH